MTSRIEGELKLLRTRFVELLFVEDGNWVRLPKIRLPDGWSFSPVDILFQFPAGYPENPFYGFYVPTGLRINDTVPQNFTDPAPAQPPFPDMTWAFLSGNPDPWQPKPEIQAGSNVMTWTNSILDRFRQKI